MGPRAVRKLKAGVEGVRAEGLSRAHDIFHEVIEATLQDHLTREAISMKPEKATLSTIIPLLPFQGCPVSYKAEEYGPPVV